jgi:8-amino-7-oxononanoate synthase
MNDFEKALGEELDSIRRQGLYRELREVTSAQGTAIELDGDRLVNFSSNDYLGLANDPRLKDAASAMAQRFGAGSGASRLISGSLAPHHALERALAEFKDCETALAFSSGYATAIGVIGALVGPGDVVVVDRLVHASIIDGARLSGAKLRVFAHNDLNALEAILKWADRRRGETIAGSRRRRVLIGTESIFSMDGDSAPLLGMVELKDRYGAWILLDEAHAAGLYGRRRGGLAEERGVANRIEIHLGTLGKALGSAGGYICGSRKLIELLVNRARSFIFSTAPNPAAAGAALEAIRLVRSEEGKRLAARLWGNVELFRRLHPPPSAGTSTLAGEAVPDRPTERRDSPIFPHRVGEEGRAVRTAQALRDLGFFAPAIRHPAVRRGQARLRITISAAHQESEIRGLAAALDRADS